MKNNLTSEEIELIYEGTCRTRRSVNDQGEKCISYFKPGHGNITSPINELPSTVYNRRLNLLRNSD
tara:strand:+ start:107155 stop:107352 length:198 start_codon:yes stop_codon:yes gene_type:complete